MNQQTPAKIKSQPAAAASYPLASTPAKPTTDMPVPIKAQHAAGWLLLAGAALILAFLDGRHGWLAAYSQTPETVAYTSLWVLLLAMVCSYLDATLGMGYGTTLVPLLLVMRLPPVVKEAALLSQLLANLAAAFFHHQAGNVNFWKDHHARNTGLLMGGAGVAAAILAMAITIRLPEHILRPAITLMVIAVGVFLLLAGGLRIKLRMRNVGVLAAIAGFNKAFSGGGYGPLVAGGQVLVGMPVRTAVATTTVAEAIVCLTAVLAYYLHGRTIPLYLLAPMCAGAVLSTPLSAHTLRRLPTRLVKKAMALAIIALGLYALHQGRGI